MRITKHEITTNMNLYMFLRLVPETPPLGAGIVEPPCRSQVARTHTAAPKQNRKIAISASGSAGVAVAASFTSNVRHGTA